MDAVDLPQQRHARFDPTRFDPVVRQLAPDARLTGVRRLTGGMSAQITVLEVVRPQSPPETVVVRQYGPKNVAADPRPATTETRLLALLRDAGMPVPQPRIAEDGTQLLGGPFSVISFIEGTGPAGSWSDPLAEQLTDVLVRLHRLDPTPARSWLRPYAERIERWLVRPPAEPDESMRETRIRQVLGTWWPQRNELPARILHGDYWPGNTMWSDGRLTAVIDWEDAGLGDQRSDLANIRLELVWAYGTDACDDVTRRYQEAFPTVDFADQPYWDLVAAARPVGRLAEWGLDPDGLTNYLTQYQEFVDAALSEIDRRPTHAAPGVAKSSPS
jgi:aminoglycoside phosphotransferase (APT) family kinase protein